MDTINTVTTKQRSIDFVAVITSFLVVFLLGYWLIFKPDSAIATISAVKASSVKVLSPFYLWLALGCLVYLLYFSFSKYGHIRFGNGKPEFNTFSWLVMMFCAGMGSSMMLWSVVEPLYYVSGPPLGAEPFSAKAYELAGTYGIYHWTFTAWALFAVGAIPLCYRFYILKKPGLSLAAACEGVLGDKVSGPLGKFIEIVVVFGILGGHGTTLVLGIPMIQNNVANLFGLPDTLATGIILIVIVTALFMASSWLGLDKGMKNLSDWNAYFAIALAVYFLTVGPTLFQINLFTNAIAFMSNNFLSMSLWTDPVNQGGFPEGWTSFYWAWWLALGPWMWIFTTRISRGRTLREVMLGMLIAGSAGCMLYFGAVGGYTLNVQLGGELDLVASLAEYGQPQTITNLILTLPLGKIILFVWAVIAIVFLATTLDSSSYTLAATTTKGLREGENPARWFKLFWAIMLAVIPCSLLFAGASLTAFQSMAVLTATPIAIFTIIALIGGAKWIFRDYSALTREQIILQENKKIDMPV
ncbi:MAG: BCCT family transporter [Marinisporobacter sp.]|jgi:BCCT family betaine/carnitine transporter|nr:BCCT family transporter [Marinisporobacter sp.]